MSTIIITGANGFIGSALVKHFSSKGWKVKALVRAALNAKVDNVSYHPYDLAKPVDDELFNATDVLVHCAYKKYETGNDADEINISGTKHLIEQCRKHNVKPVFLSSFSAHEDAVSHYGKHKFYLESLFDVKTDLVLKPGLVLGNSGLFHSIAEVIKTKKVVPLIGGGKQPLQVIAVDDLCKVIAAAIEKRLTGKLYIAEPTVITMKQLYDAIAARCNKKVVYFPLPASIALLLAAAAAGIGVKLPVSPESVKGLTQLRSFDTTADMQKVGVEVKNIYQVLDELL